MARQKSDVTNKGKTSKRSEMIEITLTYKITGTYTDEEKREMISIMKEINLFSLFGKLWQF